MYTVIYVSFCELRVYYTRSFVTDNIKELMFNIWVMLENHARIQKVLPEGVQL